MKARSFTLWYAGWVILTAHSASAVAPKLPIGPHERLFVLEKNENPQNILIVFAQLDEKCRFIPVQESRLPFDFYWLMDRERYKPVHSMIKSGVRKRLSAHASGFDNGFSVRLKDLSELHHDLKVPELKVKAVANGNSCETSTQLRLGPSDRERLLNLDTIRTETKKTFLPPFRKVTSITLVGTDAETGEKVRRTYNGR